MMEVQEASIPVDDEDDENEQCLKYDTNNMPTSWKDAQFQLNWTPRQCSEAYNIPIRTMQRWIKTAKEGREVQQHGGRKGFFDKTSIAPSYISTQTKIYLYFLSSGMYNKSA
jgi:hypothetical protein